MLCAFRAAAAVICDAHWLSNVNDTTVGDVAGMVADRAADAGAADRPATEIAAAETVATTAPARLSRICNDFGRNNLCVMCSPPCVFMVGSSAKLAQLFVGTCRLTCNMTVLNTAVSTYLRRSEEHTSELQSLR